MEPDPNRLLLVDDTLGQDALSNSLCGHGFAVDVATDQQSAFEKVSTGRYDLVLLDQQARGALDLLRLLRATYSAGELPIILMTRQDQDQDQAVLEAIERGANDTIIKPVGGSAMAARIRAHLSRARAERDARLTDPLTGLGNRQMLQARIDRALATEHEQRGLPPVVLLLDLDGFKLVNDSFGHRTGDQLLIEASKRLTRVIEQYGLSGSAAIARLGGDEFGILLEKLHGNGQLWKVAEEMLTSLAQPFSANGVRVLITASIGVAMAHNRPVSSEILLRDADLAMYRAKELGKNRWHVFHPSLSERARTRLAIAMDLHHAVERNELVAVYQPEIDLARREIVGFEALLRWRHPERGLLRPSEFIPVAEETGQIIAVGDWILAEACRQLKIWQGKFADGRTLSMNVNVSVKQLLEPNLLRRIRSLLKETGITPETLKLELTESSLMTEIDQAESVLAALQRMNIGLKLDDFGTGYSSLSYLRGMHFDSLKIDRSFINRIGPDPEALALVETIVKLADTLHMSVVAEGIETECQFNEVARLGCQTGQGYYFSPPLEADAAERLLENEYCLR